MILTSDNILEIYDDCVACNQPCYRLIDCEDYETVSTNDPAFSVYVGKTIKWIDEAEGPDFVERCATVEVYICRQETYPTPDITVIDCFKNCEECQFVPEEEEEIIVTGRKVEPGYDVPDCHRPNPTCNEC